MHSIRSTVSASRKRSPVTAGELLALQVAMCVALLWVCLPLRESQPFLAGVLIGLYVWASALVLRGIYRSPTGQLDRRFGN